MENVFTELARAPGEPIVVRFEILAASEPAPGLLVLPAGEGPHPLVVIQHPGMGSKDDYFVRDVAMRWAARGWACMGLDAPLHGERRTHDPMGLLRDRDQFGTLAAQFAEELTAAVTQVGNRYPVDLTRLGYVGYSLGSMLGLAAVAADGRYRAAAFCLIGEGGLVGTAADPASPVGRLGGVAVRVVAKTQDEFFSREATEALYAALPGEKDLVWRPGGHFEIGPDVIASAEEWLRAKL